MAKSSSRTMSVIATVLGLMMAVSGLTKLAGESHQVAMFAMVGLPNWFLALVGTFEVIGGILLLVPAATPIGSLILSTIMVGALWTHAALIIWQLYSRHDETLAASVHGDDGSPYGARQNAS